MKKKPAKKKALKKVVKKKVAGKKPQQSKKVVRKKAAGKALKKKVAKKMAPPRGGKKPARKATRKPREKRYVYYFMPGRVTGSAKMKILLGGKGANLAEMARLGIPVPPGFTLTTEICSHYFESGGKYPKGCKEQVKKAVEDVSRVLGRKFGDPENPLLFSVRSGAPASMPGMMDTVLNLGLNEEVLSGMIAQTADPRFAYDAYRRFIMMYSDVVLDELADAATKEKKYGFRHHFEELLDERKKAGGWKWDFEIPADVLKELAAEFKQHVLEKMGKPFPDDPWDQLWGAIGAVFDSWNNPRAIEYRRINRIPPHWGTATNVQAMVFGNMGDDCATGVAFTRNPATGENVFFGEWLPNAQGEDVVAGIRTPRHLDRRTGGETSLEAVMPAMYEELVGYYRKIEKHLRDMQDLEFTIEHGKLWMLQTRSGKRTAFAAIRIAVEMVHERLITKNEALGRIEPDQLNQLLRPVFDLNDKKRAIGEGRLITRGLPAGPGAATGRIVFNANRAVDMAKDGPVILVRAETSPEDIHGMNVSQGILTQRGGMTSHAALVARQMGKVCVVGAEAISIDYKAGTMTAAGHTLREGDALSLDGTMGEVIEGSIGTKPSEVLQVMEEKSLSPDEAPNYQLYMQIMKWADSARTLGVRTNADTPGQASLAVAFGAEGIGLCRTEHMFFGDGKIDAMRRMILASGSEKRREALAVLLPYQREDFIGLFMVMNGRPVTIRTLDPPLHEFLPHERNQIEKLAADMGVDPDQLAKKVEELKEFKPMLGNRGCRLGISYPEVTQMQARAIFEAAVAVFKQGVKVKPEIMIPLVGNVREFTLQRDVVVRVAKEVFAESGVKIPYKVGTMIEIPRACIRADTIAGEAEFFSFGTNDLTQTALGISRDDAGSFLNTYLESGIFKRDPFEALDQDGVGELVKMGVERGRKTNPGLKIGICGEHGGEPSSIHFCHKTGLDYVSCSPFRVPIARLAAAHAALADKK
ncbi:MAG: pyruvate, phosphate dikinase [Pseudomonadota bacterium]